MALKRIRFLLAIIFIFGNASTHVVLAQDNIDSLSYAVKAWKLAFERNGNIWVANGDGTEQQLLIRNAHYPAWSHDHTQIAFARTVISG